jgi:hypothetical protein
VQTAKLTRRNRLLTCRSQSACVLRYRDESRERQATDAPLKVNSRHARWLSRAHAHALARGLPVVGMTATQLKKCGIDARYAGVGRHIWPGMYAAPHVFERYRRSVQ